jgi:S1-C subfamily serine protease
MNGMKQPEQEHAWGRLWRLVGRTGIMLLLLSGVFSALLPEATAQASSFASSGLCTPAKRGINLALPAVVRITTTYQAQLTYYNNDGSSLTFPLGGGSYALTTTGSGALISGTGDVLTARQVINVSQQNLALLLERRAATDIAQALNESHPSQLLTAADVFNQLVNDPSIWQGNYQQPQSALYLSGQYTGPTGASSLDNLQSYPVIIAAESAPVPSIDNGLAIVHIDGLNDLPTIPLGDSSQVYPGDTVTIIGYPTSGDLPASDGSVNPDNFVTASIYPATVSAFKTTASGSKVIQVGAGIESGESGAPALNADGQLVGVVSSNGSSQVGFLQTVNDAKSLVRQAKVNVAPDAFDKRWAAAYDACASTASGHWHDAYNQYTQLARLYPQFKGVQVYREYTRAQAAHEPVPGQLPGWAIAGIVALVVAAAAAGFVLFRRRKAARASAAGMAYAGYGPGLSKGHPYDPAQLSIEALPVSTQQPGPLRASEQIVVAPLPADASLPEQPDALP